MLVEVSLPTAHSSAADMAMLWISQSPNCWRVGVLGRWDLAGFQARRANVNALARPAGLGAHALDIRIPTALGSPVRVGNVVAETGTLAANFTRSCHVDLSVLERWVSAKLEGPSGLPLGPTANLT